MILHMVDSLAAGGAERVAVNLANGLLKEGFEVGLCTTRAEGGLAQFVDPGVHRLLLNRVHTADPRGLWRYLRFCAVHRVSLIHAHGSALFLGRVLASLPPFPRLVWHDHYGMAEDNRRSVALYRTATAGASAVISVNDKLLRWACTSLKVPAGKVFYIPNPVSLPPAQHPVTLPGVPGKRVVCLANLRPQKDHSNLLDALKIVVDRDPAVHLFLVGGQPDPVYTASLRQRADELGLASNVSWLGERQDVAAILAACDIGVLASKSEGLPLALLEYGAAGLAAVSTRVGQCPEVLEEGKSGLLAPPSSPTALAESMLAVLGDADLRTNLARKLRKRVTEGYSLESASRQIANIYQRILRLPVAGPNAAAPSSTMEFPR